MGVFYFVDNEIEQGVIKLDRFYLFSFPGLSPLCTDPRLQNGIQQGAKQ